MSCINNKIQEYIEESLTYLEKFYKTEFDKTNLYEIYKNIRSEYASYGMLRAVIKVEIRPQKYKTFNGYQIKKIIDKEVILTNPKSIACGIIYYWNIHNGHDLTQRDIMDSLNFGTSSIITKAYKVVHEVLNNVPSIEIN